MHDNQQLPQPTASQLRRGLAGRRSLGLATALCSALLALPAAASEMDVDQADSLNFEGFHSDKKASIKLWERDAESETVKAYEQTTKRRDGAQVVVERLDAPAGVAPRQQIREADAGAETGQNYEIRERYTLGRSSQTPYSAFYVIEALHAQMAQLCPQGWHKLQEWTEPVDDDFYLHYVFRCR